MHSSLSRGLRRRTTLTPTLFLLMGALLAPHVAQAIPAFSRRYETSCTTCHQYHYPRLNSFGRVFRENGYQWPAGAEEQFRAKRTVQPGATNEGLAIFKEVPLSMRGQFFGVGRPVQAATSALADGAALSGTYGEEGPVAADLALYSFLIGGGSITKDVSFFFTWTPFPDPSVHQARIGLHNILKDTLGEGTLNLRAGALFLLDFQRPGHRFLSAFPAKANSVAVGLNRFAWDEATLGLEAYGRPFMGPFHYEVALVAGDPGEEGYERDAWKDLYARLSWIFFQHSSHEVRLGTFAYLGNSVIESDQEGVNLRQNDTFGMLGIDAEVDYGKLNVFGMSYARYDSDPYPNGDSAAFVAGRAQALWAISPSWFVGGRYEYAYSWTDPSLNLQDVGPHVTWAIRTNVLLSAVWRQSLLDFQESSALAVLDATF